MEFKPLVGLTYELFFTLINVLVLFLILRKILFKKVINVMDAREADIKNDIEEGQRAKEEGLKLSSKRQTVKLQRTKSRPLTILSLRFLR